MNLFNRRNVLQPPLPTQLIRRLSGPEGFANNSAYGKGFYEIGAYSVALKRCENGHDLAQQLAEMFDERAQIELNYANQLHNWSNKWHNDQSKSQDYGTNKNVWDQTALTGEQQANVHSTLSNSLTESLIPQLRQWRKDHYEKSRLHYKITKEFEKDFLDAQKSWNKLLDKIADCKTAYYNAYKTSKLADNAERSATDDQRKKFADKADVARREIAFTKTKYEQAINEAREQRTHYEDAMKQVFQRTQQFERERLNFFKQTFDDYAKLLETATLNNPILTNMNEEYRATLALHNPDTDLAWWDENYGTQTNSRWPEYEEYRD